VPSSDRCGRSPRVARSTPAAPAPGRARPGTVRAANKTSHTRPASSSCPFVPFVDFSLPISPDRSNDRPRGGVRGRRRRGRPGAVRASRRMPSPRRRRRRTGRPSAARLPHPPPTRDTPPTPARRPRSRTTSPVGPTSGSTRLAERAAPPRPLRWAADHVRHSACSVLGPTKLTLCKSNSNATHCRRPHACWRPPCGSPRPAACATRPGPRVVVVAAVARARAAVVAAVTQAAAEGVRQAAAAAQATLAGVG
jgi:hypothetical protein